MGEIRCSNILKQATLLARLRFICGGKPTQVFVVQGECYQFSHMLSIEQSLLITVNLNRAVFNRNLANYGTMKSRL